MSGIGSSNPIQAQSSQALQSPEPGAIGGGAIDPPVPNGEPAAQSQSAQPSAESCVEITDIFSAGTAAAIQEGSVSPFSTVDNAGHINQDNDDAQPVQVFDRYNLRAQSVEVNDRALADERARPDYWKAKVTPEIGRNAKLASDALDTMLKMKIKQQRSVPPELTARSSAWEPAQIKKNLNLRLCSEATRMDKRVLESMLRGVSGVTPEHLCLLRPSTADPAPAFKVNQFEFFKAISDNVANHNRDKRKQDQVSFQDVKQGRIYNAKLHNEALKAKAEAAAKAKAESETKPHGGAKVEDSPKLTSTAHLMPLNSREMTAVAVMEMVKQSDHPQLTVKRVAHKAPRALDAYMREYSVRQPGDIGLPLIPEGLDTAPGLEIYTPQSIAERTFMMEAMEEVAEHRQLKARYKKEHKINLCETLGISIEEYYDLNKIASEKYTQIKRRSLSKFVKEHVSKSAEVTEYINNDQKLKKELDKIESSRDSVDRKEYDRSINELKNIAAASLISKDSKEAMKFINKFVREFEKNIESKSKSHNLLVSTTIKQFLEYKRHQNDEGKSNFTVEDFDADPILFMSGEYYISKLIESYSKKALEYETRYLTMDEKRCADREQAFYASQNGLSPAFTQEEYDQKIKRRDSNAPSYSQKMETFKLLASGIVGLGMKTGNIPQGRLNYTKPYIPHATTQHHLIFIGDPDDEDNMVVFDPYFGQILTASELDDHIEFLSLRTGGARLDDFEDVFEIAEGSQPDVEEMRSRVEDFATRIKQIQPF